MKSRMGAGAVLWLAACSASPDANVASAELPEIYAELRVCFVEGKQMGAARPHIEPAFRAAGFEIVGCESGLQDAVADVYHDRLFLDGGYLFSAELEVRQNEDDDWIYAEPVYGEAGDLSLGAALVEQLRGESNRGRHSRARHGRSPAPLALVPAGDFAEAKVCLQFGELGQPSDYRNKEQLRRALVTALSQAGFREALECKPFKPGHGQLSVQVSGPEKGHAREGRAALTVTYSPEVGQEWIVQAKIEAIADVPVDQLAIVALNAVLASESAKAYMAEQRLMDRDSDGIADLKDDCPGEAEDPDDFEGEDGCPEPGPVRVSAALAQLRICVPATGGEGAAEMLEVRSTLRDLGLSATTCGSGEVDAWVGAIGGGSYWWIHRGGNTSSKNQERLAAVRGREKTGEKRSLKAAITELAAAPNLSAYAEVVAEQRKGTSLAAAPPTSSASSPASTAVTAAVAPSPVAGTFAAATPQLSAHALIVGIDDYRDVVDAPGARADAERFAKLAQETMGMKREHLRIALGDRATKNDIVKHIDWLVANVPAGGRIYFFYSGHGAPDPTRGTPYLVPYDGDPSYLETTTIPLQDIMDRLAGSKAKDVVGFVDSCFSGAGGRSVIPKGTKALVRMVDAKPPSRVTLLTASSGDEISGTTADGAGGLFTTHLVEALGRGKADGDGDGQIDMDELHRWIGPRVSREAQNAHRKQNPTIVSGGAKASDVSVAWGYGR